MVLLLNRSLILYETSNKYNRRWNNAIQEKIRHSISSECSIPMKWQKQQTENKKKKKKIQYVIIAIWEIDGKKQTKKNRPYTTLQSSREQASKEWNGKNITTQITIIITKISSISKQHQFNLCYTVYTLCEHMMKQGTNYRH